MDCGSGPDRLLKNGTPASAAIAVKKQSCTPKALLSNMSSEYLNQIWIWNRKKDV